MASRVPAGEATGFTVSDTEVYALTVFASITFYTSFELIILCLVTFKRYHGVYFWSLLAASTCTSVNTLGFIIFFFVPVSPYLPVTISLVGWYFMVTGHSLVLWSRVHLVLRTRALLRAILYLIIANAILMHIPITVLLYGAVSPGAASLSTSRPHNPFTTGYNIMERIQLVVFGCQEALLSIIYISETVKLLRLRPNRPSHANRVILMQTIAINIVILMLDVVTVVLQYVGLYAIQVVFKPLAYSMKLRLEYAILGNLVKVVMSGGVVRSSSSAAAWSTSPWPGTSCSESNVSWMDSRNSGGEWLTR
ncbi:hypothetical protein BJX61DRAFT_552509 [Aspergillus egyptiacus]|nr:hypothetical protein BJX61DRAFT_552509 [Aspergillus egyptiacus]